MASNSSTLITTSNKRTISNSIFARVRLAKESDAIHLHKLMYQLADYHSILPIFTATQDSVASNLFKNNPHKPFESVTSLILEVSPKPFPQLETTHPIFNPIEKTINLDVPIVDKEFLDFQISDGDNDDVYVAGYVLFFPNFSGFFEKPGFYMDNLHVRECYRGKGLGKMMFSAVASEAAKRGFSMFDWNVTSWNTATVGFYVKMGAQEVKDFRVYRLSGQALESYNTTTGYKFGFDSS